MADMRPPSSPKRAALHRGVALITAMLVVVAASVVVAESAARQLVDIRRTDNILGAERARLLAQGVESWARGMLVKDRENGPVDHLGEDWAKPLPPTRVADTTLTGTLEDLQGRLNLNALLRPDGEPDPVQVARLRRLLTALELDAGLVQGLLDWMDPDLDPRFPGGAEDGHYLRQEPPYRSANRPLASVSELRLVAGVDAEAYARLAPWVAALPEATTVNVNTAPERVLATLAEGLGPQDLEALVRGREESPYQDVESFLQHDALAGLAVEAEGLGVASRHFRVRITLERDGHTRRMTAALVRDARVRVRARSLEGASL